MPFRVKNNAKYEVIILGASLLPGEKVDLLTVTDAATITTSLMEGELYKKLQGRMLIIPHPSQDVPDLALTTNQYSFITHAGFLQARSGEEDLKPPFSFTSTGALVTSSTIAVESQSEVEGRVLNGADATGIKPVIVSGVDGLGASRALLTASDGTLLPQIEGLVSAGNPAIEANPVLIAGENPADNIANLQTDTSGNLYVVGPIADGAADTTNAIRIGAIVETDPTGTTLADGAKANLITDTNRRLYTRSAAYDILSLADRTVPVFIPQDRYENFDISRTVAAVDGTDNNYVDLDGFAYFSLTLTTAIAGTYSLTVLASNDSGTADITARTYFDITDHLFGTAAIVFNSTTPRVIIVDTPLMVNSLKFSIAFTGGGGLAVYTAYGKKGLA